MSWTPESIETLTSLWAHGLPASAIASRLGDGISRNAVIGKVHRLGLEGRVSGGRRARPNVHRAPRVIAEKKVQPIKTAPVPPRMELPAEPLALVQLVELKPRACRWPYGDPQQEGFGFCGRSHKGGSAYCDAHRAIASRGKPGRATTI